MLIRTTQKTSPPPVACPGPVKRREFLRVGLTGFASLSLPGLLRLRAQAAPAKRERRAIILVWLRGGLSHLDTYDPKPNAPEEYRGIFKTIPTRVPGMNLTELLPLHAKLADKFTLARSFSHTGGGHPAGSLQMLTGDPDPLDKPKPIYPDWMTVANYLLADRTRRIPNCVGVNGITRYDSFTITGNAYVDPAYSPFLVTGDPNNPKFEVQNIGLKDAEQTARLNDRLTLKQRLDTIARGMDRSGSMRAFDDFEAQALNLLTSSEARDAFDLNKEDARTRDRYGRHQWGQQCLLARRLVEAGVEIITTTFDGPLCGRVANWDDHAVNHHVFDALKFRAPCFDQAVTALIEDLYARGLDRRCLVVVSGAFGRTPRVSTGVSTGGGVASRPLGETQPGRDHWPRAFSNLWSGGGIPTGGIIGASDRRGEDVIERRLGPGDFLATLYHHLGINAEEISIPDFTGRPVPLLFRGGQPIPELQGRT